MSMESPMRQFSRRSILQTGAAAAALAALPFPLLAQESFAAWLRGVRSEAAGKGISQKTLDSALTGLAPIQRVIELDRDQPEFTQSFWRYMATRITDTRIAGGQTKLAQNREILTRVSRDYGLEPQTLMAFWGLETNYGGFLGGFEVIAALATLAWDARRSAFFRAELMNALLILDQGHITPKEMLGSWAGAMGQFQFMPSTFLRYAVDYDKDGRKDIWNDSDDAFASAANFLKSSGWVPNLPWGYEVVVPRDFPWQEAGQEFVQPVSRWQTLGVRLPGGGALPHQDQAGALLLPAGWRGPAFVALNNFYVILRWNNSQFYAISVGHLSDRIAGRGPLHAKPPAGEEERLSRNEIKEMQQRLNLLGYDSGEPDGRVGPKTRAALRAYQQASNLPADAFPTRAIIEALRRATA